MKMIGIAGAVASVCHDAARVEKEDISCIHSKLCGLATSDVIRSSRRKDAHDRQAIVAHLKEQLRNDDKSLVGNKGYRRYLKVEGSGHFVIDEKQVKAEECYDGIWVLRTNTFYNAETVAHVYKALWTVEDMILSKMIPGASQFVAGTPIASAILAKNGRVFIASGLGIVMPHEGRCSILPRGFPQWAAP